MNMSRILAAAGVASMLLMLSIAGCETSEDTSASGDLTGSWLYSDSDGTQSTWALVQSSSGAVSGAGTEGEKITGTVSADSIVMSLTFSSSNSTTSLSGTMTGSTMTGSFSNSVTSGSWTAVETNI